MIRPLTLVLAAALLLAACRDAGPLFELTGRVFIFNPRVASATYVITLRPLAADRRAARIVAAFENPAGGEDLVVTQRIWPNADKVALESPPLTCVAKDRTYRVTIRVEDGAGAVLQRLDTTVTSTLDQSVMPDAPLVVGPAYDPNPALAGHPDGKIPGARRPVCPDPPAQ